MHDGVIRTTTLEKVISSRPVNRQAGIVTSQRGTYNAAPAPKLQISGERCSALRQALRRQKEKEKPIMIEPRIKLPGTPTKRQELLPPGTKVKLKNAPQGGEGVVVATVRNRLQIRWPSEGFTGKYRPESLIVVGVVKQPEAPAPRENPYHRLIRRLHADMHVKPQPLTTKEL
jgi:hypothetical protein